MTKFPYPHPLIAREGWPFLAISVVISVLLSVFVGWWSLPFWVVSLFVLQFFRDPPREGSTAPNAVLSPPMAVL